MAACRAALVVVVLFALAESCFGQASSQVTSDTAATWANSLQAQLSAAEQNLLVIPTIQSSYESSAFTARQVSGEEQVALFAVKITKALSSKTDLLSQLQTALEMQWDQGTVDPGSAACSDLNATAASFSESCVVVPPWMDAASVAYELRATALLDSALAAAWNQTDQPRVRNVFAAGAGGVLRSYPGGPWQPGPAYDPRLTSWYTGAVAGRRRAVIVLDAAASSPTALHTAAQALLSSFADHDAVGLLGHSKADQLDATAGAGCAFGAFQGLLRATPEARIFLSATLSAAANTSSNTLLAFQPILSRAFELADGDGHWLDRSYTPWVLLLSDGGLRHTGARDHVSRLAEHFPNVRLGVLEIRGGGPAKNPEASSELQRAACATGGAYTAVAPGADPLPYLPPLIHALATQVAGVVPPSWLLTLGHRAGNGSKGVLLTITSVVRGPNGRTLGVVGMDVPLDELQQASDQTVFHLSYAFLVTAFGDAVVHPRLATGSPAGAATNLYTKPPLYRDITILEDSPEFPSLVRAPMLSRFSGSASYTLLRALPQGDGSFNAPQSREVQNTFYWQQLPGFPFVACSSFAQDDLVELEFDPKFNGSVTPQYYASLRNYPPELLPGGVPVGSPGGASTFLGVDNTTLYTLDFGNYFFASTAFSSAKDLERIVGNPTTLGPLVRYVNQEPGAQNPGVIDERVVNEVHVTAPVIPAWMQAHKNFNLLYQLKNLYFSTQLGTRRTYPSILATPASWFNSVKRPWYLLATANPDRLVLTPPYLDATSQLADHAPASVLTFCKTVYARGQLVGVSATDLAYPQLHAFVYSNTSCQRFRNETGAPKCFLLDRSGLLATSFRFYDPIIVSGQYRTPIINVFLGEEEPELATVLLTRGVLTQVPAKDFAKAPPLLQTVYAVNESLLAPGVQLNGSFASACSQGMYYMQAVEATNLFFLVIHSYVDGDRNDTSCPVFSAPGMAAQELPYGVCGANISEALVLPSGAGVSVQLQPVPDEARPAGFICRLVPQEVRRVKPHGWVTILFQVLAALGLLMILALAAVVFIYRRVSVIYTTNLTFIATHLIGLALGYASIFVFATRPSDAVCVLMPLLAGIAFVLVVGSMLAKMIRIWRVLSNTTVLSVPITNREFFMYVGSMVAVEVLLLIGWSAAARLKPHYSLAHASSNTYVLTCHGDAEWVLVGLQAGYCAVLLVIGVVLSFALRRVHSKVLWGESKWASNCIYIIFLFSSVLFVTRVVLRKQPDAQLAATAACIWLMCTCTLVLFYTLKFYVLFLRPDLAAESTTGDFSTEFTPEDVDHPI